LCVMNCVICRVTFVKVKNPKEHLRKLFMIPFFILREDPGERRELAGDPRHRRRRDELAGVMDGWLRRTGWPT